MLFCESPQTLYALNGAAAIVWCALEDRLEEGESLGALVSAGVNGCESRAHIGIQGWPRGSSGRRYRNSGAVRRI